MEKRTHQHLEIYLMRRIVIYGLLKLITIRDKGTKRQVIMRQLEELLYQEIKYRIASKRNLILKLFQANKKNR